MDTNKLFVRNLAWGVDDEQLRKLFEDAGVGEVQEATVVRDRETNRSRGFGFVTMATPEQAEAAMQKLNGQDLGGRALAINEAKPKEERARF